MQYIIEYEAVDSKICGIVKNPYSGTPLFITDLYDTQDQAALKVQEYTNNTPIVNNPACTPPKKCCGRS